ncbi:PREDICTED: BPI fold-containing family A member 1 [Condylura cristata]|uniref:BPI fold-containing family A member 1 n=1 Tax=Condylura cristata TaxID=143302 RepID=UPI0003345F6D|nr:PREDICTED: BPI fold-containing family A member 1 [Condylura cristata]
MLQTGSLVVFCGLLAQATALPGNLPLALNLDQNPPWAGAPGLTPAQNPTDLAGSLISALSNGLLSGGLLEILRDLPLLDILKTEGHNSNGLLGGLVETVNTLIPSLKNIIDIEIINPQLLELGLTQSPDRHRLYVTLPLKMVLSVKAPLVENLLQLAVKLNLTVEVAAVTDEQGKTHLALGDCTHSPGSLEISLLTGLPSLPIQNFVDTINEVLTNVLPNLVQEMVCPLVNNIIKQLDLTLVHSIISMLTHGLELVIKV